MIAGCDKEAVISHGAPQHYFTSRETMLSFAVDLAYEQKTQRIGQGLQELGDLQNGRWPTAS